MSGAARLFPVGHLVDVWRDGVDGPPRTWLVRVRSELLQLDAARFAVWAQAHSRVGHPVGTPWTRADVVAAAVAGRDLPAATAERAVDDLLARRALAEVADGDDERRRFLTAHSLLPLVIGLGNTAERPTVFALGLPQQTLVTGPRALHDLVGHSPGHSSMWAACRAAARDAVALDVPLDVIRDPDRTAGLLVDNLHALLAPHAVRLDVSGMP